MEIKYSHFSHAKHNKELCDFLIAQGDKYDDWVITTAFYSAHHFLKHKLFPLKTTINNKNIKVETWEDYCLFTNQSDGKHKIMRKLVENNCEKEIATAYNRLLDLSFTARYHEYKFSTNEAIIAKEYLDFIEKKCV